MALREKLHIMIVDDMSTSRGLLIQAVEELGIMHNDYCTDGATAFSQLSARPVHLVISDYNMPNMNGLELLKALRTHGSTQKIAFILVSGTPTREILDTGRALGMNNFLKKPFTTNDMRTCIESVVGRL
jgi:two-component system chemotaxis response regulator CheY